MPATIEPAKREKLFNQVRHMLGAPIRGVELEDEMLDTAIELAILDYGQYVQDWLIEVSFPHESSLSSSWICKKIILS